MRFNIFRSKAASLGVAVSAIGAIALSVYFFFPLLSRSRPEAPTARPTVAEMEHQLKELQAEAAKDPARPTIVEMESRLRALQVEAAKDPAKPTIAEMERRLDRMAAERGAAHPAGRPYPNRPVM